MLMSLRSSLPSAADIKKCQAGAGVKIYIVGFIIINTNADIENRRAPRSFLRIIEADQQSGFIVAARYSVT